MCRLDGKVAMRAHRQGEGTGWVRRAPGPTPSGSPVPPGTLINNHWDATELTDLPEHRDVGHAVAARRTGRLGQTAVPTPTGSHRVISGNDAVRQEDSLTARREVQWAHPGKRSRW